MEPRFNAATGKFPKHYFIGMNRDESLVLLEKYLPEGTAETVYNWLIEKKVHFRITRKRSTKLGDYKPPLNYPTHRISVNGDLNPYAFLITFLHELAHLLVYEKYGNTVKPHGDQWKRQYRSLMTPYLEQNVFPADLKRVLVRHLENSRASSHADMELTRILKSYNREQEKGEVKTVYLESVPQGGIFLFGNNRKFEKMEKKRVRYRCKELKTGRLYLFHPLAEVIPLNDRS